MKKADFSVDPGGYPVLTECPADDCSETEDLMVQECAPGHTWMFTGAVCGHWGFIHRDAETEER